MSARSRTDPLRSVELGGDADPAAHHKLCRPARGSHSRGVEHPEAHRRRGRDAEATSIAGRGSTDLFWMLAVKASELDGPFETLSGCFGDSTNNDLGSVSRLACVHATRRVGLRAGLLAGRVSG